MRNVLPLILLLLSMDISAALPQKNYAHVRKISSSYDRKAALLLVDFITSIDNKSVHLKSVKRLHRQLRRSKGFLHLRPLTAKALKIAIVGKSLNKFHHACKIPEMQNPTYIFQTIQHKIKSYCASLFIGLFSSSKRFTKNDRLYFQKNLDYYLNYSPDQVIALVDKSKNKNPRLFRELSLLISQEYISSGLFPDPDIIGAINLSEDFLLYLEQIGINDLETQKYLTGEFKRLRHALRKALNSNDYETAKTLSGHLLSFHSQNYQYLPTTISWKTFLSAGKKLITSNNFVEGMQALDYASKISPANKKDQIVFFLLWGNLIGKKYNESMKIIRSYNLIERFNHLDSRLKYWVCHTLLKTNEDHLAKHFMRKITSENPMDFYSIVALRELSQLYAVKPESTFLKTIRTPASIKIPQFKQFNRNYQNSLRRLDSWVHAGSSKYSQQEISYIFSSDTKQFLPPKYDHDELCNSDCIIARHLAQYLTNAGEYLHAFRLINKTLIDNAIDRNIVTQLFPTKYRKSIQQKTNDLDSSLILALIRQESAFNPKATSIVGAKGLMQLMPTTAQQLSKDVNLKQLTNPDLNIKLGIQYLTSLAKKYDGNLIYTLAAYNAGPSRIRHWMEHVFSTDNPLLMIESIPFKETRQYVKLIYRNIFFYKFLNNEIDLSTSVPESFKIKLTSNN